MTSNQTQAVPDGLGKYRKLSALQKFRFIILCYYYATEKPLPDSFWKIFLHKISRNSKGSPWEGFNLWLIWRFSEENRNYTEKKACYYLYLKDVINIVILKEISRTERNWIVTKNLKVRITILSIHFTPFVVAFHLAEYAICCLINI